ncbi:MAG: hypothetical protein ACLPXZ_29255 [Mycobacterium sp.]
MRARSGFWRFRRSRPLAASLPMTDAERRTMTAGWFVAQIIGRIRIPAAPYAEPVRIYDDAAERWLDFPSPLLTPPSEFKASYDWLPAVLESILLAMAQSHQPPMMASLRPYQALRELFDANPHDPASGIVQLSAVQLLREFVESGSSGTGLASRVPTIAAAATPADRIAATEEWLGTIRDIAAAYLPAGAPGASPDGSFSAIATRGKAAKTPLFRDLAPECSGQRRR